MFSWRAAHCKSISALQHWSLCSNYFSLEKCILTITARDVFNYTNMIDTMKCQRWPDPSIKINLTAGEYHSLFSLSSIFEFNGRDYLYNLWPIICWHLQNLSLWNWYRCIAFILNHIWYRISVNLDWQNASANCSKQNRIGLDSTRTVRETVLTAFDHSTDVIR